MTSKKGKENRGEGWRRIVDYISNPNSDQPESNALEFPLDPKIAVVASKV